MKASVTILYILFIVGSCQCQVIDSAEIVHGKVISCWVYSRNVNYHLDITKDSIWEYGVQAINSDERPRIVLLEDIELQEEIVTKQ